HRAMVGGGAGRVLGQPRGPPGGDAGRPRHRGAAPVRLGRPQGRAGSAEPLSDRRPRTGATPPAGRPPDRLPGPPPGRRLTTGRRHFTGTVPLTVASSI